MISVQKLKQAIDESQMLPDVSSISRPKYQNWLAESQKNTLIKAIVGFRRAGKSHLLKMLTQKLQKETPNIFYLNFENDLLRTIKTVADLRAVWEMYKRELAVPRKQVFIIWDEIQLVQSWEKLVRTLYEQGEYNIFLSGSNSKLLSGELSSSLSGRSLQLEVRPFSFKEYLEFCQKRQIDGSFMTYLSRGGLPEQFLLSENLARDYGQGLIQKIILDDIAKRYQIDKINVLRQAFEYVCGNITSTLSLRRIAGLLEEQGLPVAIETLDNYLSYWQTVYALDRVVKFDYKLKRVFDRTAKYYCVDNLLIPGREEAQEKRLENLVYNELVLHYGREKVFFGQEENGYEVDFVVKTNGEFLFFQICWQLNNKNAKREIGNLELINKYLPGKSFVLYIEDLRSDASLPPEIKVENVENWLMI
ncbi:MAG: ATP-binding protein [bacterium]|nr:ATP-binding protein [bacterium]